MKVYTLKEYYFPSIVNKKGQLQGYGCNFLFFFFLWTSSPVDCAMFLNSLNYTCFVSVLIEEQM